MDWLKKLFSSGEEPHVVESTADTPSTAESSSSTGIDPKRFSLPGMPRIRIGRYSDNNKNSAQIKAWLAAEAHFKAKEYAGASAEFFTFLRDAGEENVRFTAKEKGYEFELFQGSEHITGSSDGEYLYACACLAHMQKPAVAPMRRLLNLNYSLLYSRCAMSNDNTLCIIFETDIASASPTKLYSGLRELATRADRQDDLLLTDFGTLLQPVDTAHVKDISNEELRHKFSWFRRWLTNALSAADSLNADSFSGAIAYELLTAMYRIDFLLRPEAKLLSELERINKLYWDRKDEVSLIARNAMIREELRKLLAWTEDDLRHSLYHAKDTFGVAANARLDKVKDNTVSALRDTQWYIDNQYPHIAQTIVEYGLLYAHYIYGMPKVLTDLTAILEAVLHPGYFAGLGMNPLFYDEAAERLNEGAIKSAIDAAISPWTERFPNLRWDHGRIPYTSRYDFSLLFSEMTAGLNLETKRGA